MSDLQRRSEALLRERGYLTGSVERRKSFPAKGKVACRACGHLPLINISVDLWNVFDLLALRPSIGFDTGKSVGVVDIVFVQVTSSTNHATHRNKILASAEARLCILAGAKILLQSWRKHHNRWQSQDEWIGLSEFAKGLPNTVEAFYESQRKERLPDLPPGTTLPLSPDLGTEPF